MRSLSAASRTYANFLVLVSWGSATLHPRLYAVPAPRAQEERARRAVFNSHDLQVVEQNHRRIFDNSLRGLNVEVAIDLKCFDFLSVFQSLS